jgi:hypothetical protein
MFRFRLKIIKPEPIGQFKPYIGTEDQFQMSVAEYLDIKGLFWIHPANERKTNTFTNKKGQKVSIEGFILKKKGVKKGAFFSCFLGQTKIIH